MATSKLDPGIASQEGEYYNILSLDGGGIRGIIPAVIIREMEKYAFKYIEDNNLMELVLRDGLYHLVDEEHKLVHMTFLFDMVAGTSTGSIITAGLTKPAMKYGKVVKDPLIRP